MSDISFATDKTRKFDFSKSAVVIIDENQTCQKVLTSILNGFGFRKVRRFEFLREGVEEVKTCPTDLIFVDPSHYGEEAFNFVRWLRSDRNIESHSAAILMTAGFTPIRLITTSRQSGADYVVAKPFSASTMLERILWVAVNQDRRGGLSAPDSLVSNSGSGMELW